MSIKNRCAIVTFVLSSLLSSLLFAGDSAEAGSSRAELTIYAAAYSPNRLLEILGVQGGTVRITDSAWLLGAAYADTFATTGAHLDWVWEGQLVQHLGEQRHQELNILLLARWTRFPWDNYLNTSIAFGQGLSFATREPPLEPRTDTDEESSRLLNYLLVEVEVARPGEQRWSLVARVHHRSGVFGLYGGVRGGSNFVGAGLRYRF